MYSEKLEHGKVIRRLRMERGMTIEEVAEAINEDVQFIQDLENEMYPDINLAVFLYLSKVFNMDISEMVDEIQEENIDYLNRTVYNLMPKENKITENQ